MAFYEAPDGTTWVSEAAYDRWLAQQGQDHDDDPVDDPADDPPGTSDNDNSDDDTSDDDGYRPYDSGDTSNDSGFYEAPDGTTWVNRAAHERWLASQGHDDTSDNDDTSDDDAYPDDGYPDIGASTPSTSFDDGGVDDGPEYHEQTNTWRTKTGRLVSSRAEAVAINQYYDESSNSTVGAYVPGYVGVTYSGDGYYLDNEGHRYDNPASAERGTVLNTGGSASADNYIPILQRRTERVYGGRYGNAGADVPIGRLDGRDRELLDLVYSMREQGYSEDAIRENAALAGFNPNDPLILGAVVQRSGIPGHSVVHTHEPYSPNLRAFRVVDGRVVWGAPLEGATPVTVGGYGPGLGLVDSEGDAETIYDRIHAVTDPRTGEQAVVAEHAESGQQLAFDLDALISQGATVDDVIAALDAAGLFFPNAQTGKPLSAMELEALLEARMAVVDALHDLAAVYGPNLSDWDALLRDLSDEQKAPVVREQIRAAYGQETLQEVDDWFSVAKPQAELAEEYGEGLSDWQGLFSDLDEDPETARRVRDLLLAADPDGSLLRDVLRQKGESDAALLARYPDMRDLRPFEGDGGYDLVGYLRAHPDGAARLLELGFSSDDVTAAQEQAASAFSPMADVAVSGGEGAAAPETFAAIPGLAELAPYASEDGYDLVGYLLENRDGAERLQEMGFDASAVQESVAIADGLDALEPYQDDGGGGYDLAGYLRDNPRGAAVLRQIGFDESDVSAAAATAAADIVADNRASAGVFDAPFDMDGSADEDALREGPPTSGGDAFGGALDALRDGLEEPIELAPLGFDPEESYERKMGLANQPAGAVPSSALRAPSGLHATSGIHAYAVGGGAFDLAAYLGDNPNGGERLITLGFTASDVASAADEALRNHRVDHGVNAAFIPPGDLRDRLSLERLVRDAGEAAEQEAAEVVASVEPAPALNRAVDLASEEPAAYEGLTTREGNPYLAAMYDRIVDAVNEPSRGRPLVTREYNLAPHLVDDLVTLIQESDLPPDEKATLTGVVQTNTDKPRVVGNVLNYMTQHSDAVREVDDVEDALGRWSTAIGTLTPAQQAIVSREGFDFGGTEEIDEMEAAGIPFPMQMDLSRADRDVRQSVGEAQGDSVATKVAVALTIEAVGAVTPLPPGVGTFVTNVRRTFTPRSLGGSWIRGTNPRWSVDRIPGAPYDQEVLDASLSARQQIAETGSAEVTVGGNTYRFPPTQYDLALREANVIPDDHLLVTHTTQNIRNIAPGGPVPEFYFPNTNILKPLPEQATYFTPGGIGARRMLGSSAFGAQGDAPAFATMMMRRDDLVVPGGPTEPLGTNYYLGRELEYAAPTGVSLPPSRDIGLFDGNSHLYLSENMTAPSEWARMRANLRVIGRGGDGAATQGRRATPDEIARSRFGKTVDELTPDEQAYVRKALLDDEELLQAARAGDSQAESILHTRAYWDEHVRRQGGDAVTPTRRPGFERTAVAGLTDRLPRTRGRDDDGDRIRTDRDEPVESTRTRGDVPHDPPRTGKGVPYEPARTRFDAPNDPTRTQFKAPRYDLPRLKTPTFKTPRFPPPGPPTTPTLRTPTVPPTTPKTPRLRVPTIHPPPVRPPTPPPTTPRLRTTRFPPRPPRPESKEFDEGPGQPEVVEWKAGDTAVEYNLYTGEGSAQIAEEHTGRPIDTIRVVRRVDAPPPPDREVEVSGGVLRITSRGVEHVPGVTPVLAQRGGRNGAPRERSGRRRRRDTPR